MLAFYGIQGLIDKGTKEGALINEKFYYISSTYVSDSKPEAFPSFSGIPFATCTDPANLTTCKDFKISTFLYNSAIRNQLKYFYSSLAIVCSN